MEESDKIHTLTYNYMTAHFIGMVQNVLITGNRNTDMLLVEQKLISFGAPEFTLVFSEVRVYQRPNPYIHTYIPGADPGFQVRGGALKKIAPSGGRCENVWGISCEKSRFYAQKKNHIFSNFRGARAGCAPPLDSLLNSMPDSVIYIRRS
jgi:hypothetical protein